VSSIAVHREKRWYILALPKGMVEEDEEDEDEDDVIMPVPVPTMEEVLAVPLSMGKGALDVDVIMAELEEKLVVVLA